jgi:hypothetical protein
LLGFIGSYPYQGKWGKASFFPQTSGYLSIGSGQTFVAARAGQLWLGINDDAVSKNDGDNSGALHPVIITTGRRDVTGPIIKIKAPTTVYPLDSTTAAHYSCTDPDDAVASCAGPVASGRPFNTSRSGPSIFTVVASDSHGNVSSATVSYTVGSVGVAPLVYPFKPQSVGTASAAKTVRLFNRQTTALNISSTSTTGDFKVTATTCGSVLAAEKSCSTNVAFVPSTTGSRQGQLQVQTDAGAQSVILVGVGK